MLKPDDPILVTLYQLDETRRSLASFCRDERWEEASIRVDRARVSLAQLETMIFQRKVAAAPTSASAKGMEAMQILARLYAAGWRVGDDGDPYEIT